MKKYLFTSLFIFLYALTLKAETLSLEQIWSSAGRLFQSAPVLPLPTQERKGSILREGTILKYDQYPGVHEDSLQKKYFHPRLDGVPNYRPDTIQHLHLSGQPTLEGLRAVLKKAGSQTVLWMNLREEPIIYIHGRPYNLRRQSSPFSNHSETGITAENLENAEKTLKKEILEEAEGLGGKILLHDESTDMKLISAEHGVSAASVQTPREIYEQLAREGFQVKLIRIPITDEQAPEAADLDALTQIFDQQDSCTDLALNCHAGRGRTTTAAVAAEILRQARAGNRAASLPENGFKAISELVQKLPSGVKAKAQADAAIDRLATLVNLREEIHKTKLKADQSPADKKGKYEARAKDFLRRYGMLIFYSAYCHETKGASSIPFSIWLQKYAEAYQALHQAGLD